MSVIKLKKIIYIIFFFFICNSFLLAEGIDTNFFTQSKKSSFLFKNKSLSEQQKLDFDGSEPVKLAGLLIKVVITLIFIFLFFYFIKKYFANKRVVIDEKVGVIDILAVFPLTPNKYIYLLDFVDKIFVLGVTDANINLITIISDKEQIDQLKLISDMNVSANSKKTFLDFVISSFSKKKNYKPEDFKNINDFK